MSSRISSTPLESSLDGTADSRLPPSRLIDQFLYWVYRFPWWAAALLLLGIMVYTAIAADQVYENIFRQLRAGIELTLRVSFISYGLALVVGLIIGIIRSEQPKPGSGILRFIWSLIHLIIYNVATLLVEVMRGLPLLVLLLIAAFVAIPEFKDYVQQTFGITIGFRSTSVETVIIALALAYGAFLSEVFRAGIQSIDKGQREAARSLGMTYTQTMRLVVLPQAIRRILPPLGNDFIAMIKDSSLVAYLGLRDITQIGKVSSGSSFLYLETYLTVAVLYLTMTILGSVLVRLLERYLKQAER